MLKKICLLVLVFMYLYTLTFNIFMTSVFRIPAPIIFAIPLIVLFRNPLVDSFKYMYEILVFFLAAVLYFLLGEGNIVTFFSVMIIIICCSMYFNFFVAYSSERFKLSIIIFYSLLFISGVVMLLDHVYKIGSIRSFLIGQQVQQSPSGISVMVFTYGYQLAAFVSFLAIWVASRSKSLLLHFFSIGVCLVFILYGMQRSALMAFIFCLVVFWILYFRSKAVIMFGMICITGIFLSTSIQNLSNGKQDNILNKNERNKDAGENREGLMLENFKVIADYPFGLIFSGKHWNDVVKHNVVYKSGTQIISSHNAYLMFITYTGIILGIFFLVLIYRKVGLITWYALTHVRDKKNALLVALCFSFIGISINSCFHNEWLLAASGPSIFLYFSILHYHTVQPK